MQDPDIANGDYTKAIGRKRQKKKVRQGVRFRNDTPRIKKTKKKKKGLGKTAGPKRETGTRIYGGGNDVDFFYRIQKGY